MTQSVFFAHANGFPLATYGKLFAALVPDYSVQHLEQHGHLVRRVPKGEYLRLPGGHMFPLERPQDSAELLKKLFQRWTVQPASEQRA